MNPKLTRLLQWLREGLEQIVRGHPVELLMIVCGCGVAVAAFELDSDRMASRVAVFALFGVVALAVGNLAGRGPWRKIYWVCWLPAVPLALWPGWPEWFATMEGGLTVCVLAPLILLACRLAVRNDRFVSDAVVWFRSAVLAFFFANAALPLFCAILYSTVYIFGLDGEWIRRTAVYAVILAETVAVPVLFLMMADRWCGAECRGHRIVDILLNYIVTPALLVYTAILSLYTLKIVFTWSLPQGGVAYLVFGFTLMALAVKAMQCLLQKPIYDWFFDRFSLIAMPLQVLFWVGAFQRIADYGFTEARVFLVVCGGLMTLCVLAFLARRTGRYLYICLAAFGVFSAMVFVPSLHAEQIALRSQEHRVVRIADALGLMKEDRSLRLEQFPMVDTAQRTRLRALYTSIDYLETRDTVFFAQLGLRDMDDFTDRLPSSIKSYVRNGWDDSANDEDRTDYFTLRAESSVVTNIDGYKVLYSDLDRWDGSGAEYRFQHDTLRIAFKGARPDIVISGSGLLKSRLLEIPGMGENPGIHTIKEFRTEWLRYESDEYMILFSSISLSRSDSTLTLRDVRVDAVLTR